MAVSHNEYHPYGACLMMMFCNDGDRVRENLKAIIEHGRVVGAESSDARIRKFSAAFKSYARRKHSDAHVLQPAIDELTALNRAGVK